jgi:hypothetical protein
LFPVAEEANRDKSGTRLLQEFKAQPDRWGSRAKVICSRGLPTIPGGGGPSNVGSAGADGPEAAKKLKRNDALCGSGRNGQ